MTDHPARPDRQDDTIVPAHAATTESFPRPRTGVGPPTRLDVHRAYDVADPTREVTVSPIGVHTVGAAAATTPQDIPAVSVLNAFLDDRDRLRQDRERVAADTRRAWRGRPAERSVREVAAARAAAKLRHEQRLERIETARAVVTLLIFIALLIIVIGADIVGYGIISGYFTWAPVHTP